jgi:mRNA-degrading endonuclease toxin of MazEF toxin-antitoxin module
MTSDSGAWKRWDVAIALFPFTESKQRKPRPMLILSEGIFNDQHGHVIAAMITTGINTQWPSDHSINNLEAAGLKQTSVVRWKIFTLPINLISRKIGSLASEDRGLLSVRMAGILLG